MTVGNPSLFTVLSVVLLLIAVAVTLVGSAFAAAGFHRAVRRGHPPATGWLLATVPPLLGLAVPVTVVVVAAGDRLDEPSQARDMAPELFLMGCAVGILSGAGAAWVVGGLLPVRPRTPGVRPRRHRYGAWATAVNILVVPGAAAALVFAGWETAGRVLLVGIPAAEGLRLLERRSAAQMHEAPEAKVLLLRAFSDDQVASVYMRSGESSWADSSGWVSMEKFLAEAMEEQIGPMVALGSPRDVLPPGGGTRLYPADTDWQRQFVALAHQVRAIVMLPGDTEAIGWELRVLAGEGLHTRLFLLTPPSRRYGRLDVPAMIGAAFGRLLFRLAGWRSVGWDRFARHLELAGLSAGRDPGPGALLTYTADRKPVLLGRDLTAAPEFVRRIAAHLS